MKIKQVKIKNYRSCKDVVIDFESIHALVGPNNAGKSSILRALDFLFNPSRYKIDEESYWNGNKDNPIWIEAIFDDLSADEIESLGGYLKDDESFHMARYAMLSGEEDEDTDSKVIIGQKYCNKVPKYDWLQENKINGKMIGEWLTSPEQLVVNGLNFAEIVGNKPKVGEWKEKAKEVVSTSLTPDDFIEEWIDNPKGYAGVLKSTLPHFIFVPAVKEASDEAKVTKSSPFGKLIYEILKGITAEQTIEMEQSMSRLRARLNRVGGSERIADIVNTEERINKILSSYIPCDLEMEFQPPTIEVILTSPRIFVNDGFRNTIENKGHGLQRAFIFSVLQCYSELVTGYGDNKKRSMIFGVEEPELYMHPQAQRNIRKIFQGIAANGRDQVVFSTHSALLVDVAYFDEIIRVEKQKINSEGEDTVCTKVWQLPMKKMIVDLTTRVPKAKPTPESMRDLYSHAYHPTRSEGFFAEKVILVEGPTEAYSLPIYAEAMGILLDRENIGIVECVGKGQMDRLYRIFNELGIACYLLFDYDQGKDSEVMSKDLLALLGYTGKIQGPVCVEPTFAFFINKWETQINSEIPDVENLTAQARKTLALSADTGKPLVARYIAREITSWGAPLIPPTIVDILSAAVEVGWSSSCLRC
ncbi:ATP-dependent nuclease [Desulfoferula mesophila]|uniref:ATP-dependent endonuclease n=1 Tax=Desulfoferula mesophila TaxID=3058419 RepID=A0AAU9E7B1_9BACT|nr:ATP-dependent endonuclease [Desulfoferula mesophilus]